MMLQPQFGNTFRMPTGPMFSAAQKPAAAPRFSGLHQDAISGGDIKPWGTQKHADTTAALFETVKNAQKFGILNQPVQLTVKFESGTLALYANLGPEGKNQQKIGDVPGPLRDRLLPVIHSGQPFTAFVTSIKPYKKDKETFHSIVVRLECLSPQGKTPNPAIASDVEMAFYNTRHQEKEGWKTILTVIPEEFSTHKIGGETILERQNDERKEASFFVNGHLASRVKLNPTAIVVPEFTDEKLSATVKKQILRRANPEYTPLELTETANKFDKTA